MITTFKAKHKTRLYLIAFLIASVTFIFYIPALNNGFVNYDDDVYVYENNNIRSIDTKLLSWIFKAEANPTWHPLTLFSLALDYAIWGLNPMGYHLTNNFFHAVNTFLVFLLTIQLLEGVCRERAYYKVLIGGVTAYLFGVHPLHVESVAWISERKDVLCAFFFLLCILSYLKYINHKSIRKYVSYGLCLTLFILALLSKPMAVSLPIVLLILDFYPLQRLTLEKGLTGQKGILLEKLPLFLLSLIISFINISVQETGGALKSTESYPLMGRTYVAISAYVLYLIKMILPFNLSPYYRYPAKIDFFTLKYLGPFVLLIVISFYSIKAAKKNRIYLAIWSYYLITLVPVIGIFKVGGHAMADRYTYLPSIGPFLLAGLGIATLFERASRKQIKISMIAAMIIISGLLANLTVKQIAVWRDSITFWSRMIRYMPEGKLPYFYRGNAYFDLSKYESAIVDYGRAVVIDPTYADAFNNRGYSYYKLGLYQMAVRDFDSVLALDPQNASGYNNRGMAHGRLGNLESAIYDFNRAIILNPSFAEGYYNRGNAYEAIGDYNLAVTDYNQVLLINPSHPKASLRLNKLHSKMQR